MLLLDLDVTVEFAEKEDIYVARFTNLNRNKGDNMGFLFHERKSNTEDYDYDSLRRDLVDEYGAQSAAFSGGFGCLQI